MCGSRVSIHRVLESLERQFAGPEFSSCSRFRDPSPPIHDPTITILPE